MSYRPPDQPQYTGNFPEQYGYKDIQIRTHNYSGHPKPLSPSTHRMDGGGFSQSAKNFANDEKTKKVVRFIWGQLRGFICS